MDSENAPCEEVGYIKRWDGYFIEAEQQLVCTACSEIIPNCVTCTSNEACTVCADGYSPNIITGNDGVERPVCLKSFCGVEGFGEFCTSMEDDSEGEYPLDCRRATRYSYTFNKTTTNYYDCEQCRQGYYSYVYGASMTEYKLLRKCRKQEYSITKDFFVMPERGDFFTSGLEADMNKQLHEPAGRGQSPDDPLYFLQQAFTLSG